MKQTKLCVACRAYVPIEQFDKAAFTTRDGYRHCCRNHVMPRYRRLENGRLEEVKDGGYGE